MIKQNKENVGRTDKTLRFIVGLILFYFAFKLENRLVIIILSSLGAISILESFTGYCGIYKLFKINTMGGK